MTQDNSKPTFFSVKDKWEMFDLAYELQNIEDVVYHVIDKNKFFIQMIDGTFVDYGSTITTPLKPSVKPEVKVSFIYPDEDTYRI